MLIVYSFVIAIGFAGALLAIAALLHFLLRLGSLGQRISNVLCRAPALDVIVGCFTVLPLVVGPWRAGWAGLAAAVAGQVIAAVVWVTVQESIHRGATRGPRIVTVLNRIVGRWRNHAALWTTAIVAPAFMLARVVEMTVYPILTVLVGLPSYRQGEWVNVSRHKFRGLVGHDLLWCLYCDWMTGVVSLAVEMLRNVESFWCPIRFASDKKCENCSIDFPDINRAWIDAGGTMSEVSALLEKSYSGKDRSWISRRVKLPIIE